MKQFRVLCLTKTRCDFGSESLEVLPGDTFVLNDECLYFRVDHREAVRDLGAEFYILGALNTHFAVEPF